jgi:hypothetical protein
MGLPVLPAEEAAFCLPPKTAPKSLQVLNLLRSPLTLDIARQIRTALAALGSTQNEIASRSCLKQATGGASCTKI